MVTAGRELGIRTRHSVVHDEAPSSRAASIRLRGMVAKWARIQNTPNGMNAPISARARPGTVLVSPTARRS